MLPTPSPLHWRSQQLGASSLPPFSKGMDATTLTASSLELFS